MPELRACKTCGAEKPLGEFPPYRANAATTGRRHTCRACWNKRWGPVVVEHNRRHYQENVNGYRDKKIAQAKRFQAEHPEKKRAHVLVQRALGLGALTRQPCERCGAGAEAHHDDYTRPLDVRWLCRLHHSEHHREQERRESKRA